MRSVDRVPGGALRVGAGRGRLLPGPGPRDERQQQQPQVRQTGRAADAVQVRVRRPGRHRQRLQPAGAERRGAGQTTLVPTCPHVSHVAHVHR